jgi:hypothetical protein
MSNKFVVLARFFLDTGTEYISNVPVNHPNWIYEGRVLKWGSIERSIPSPIGLPRVSDAQIRVADTDRKYRGLLATQTARRRFVELKVLEEGTSEAATEPIYRGEVVNTSFGPGYVEIDMRDVTFSWIDEQMPNVINRANYPFLAEGLDEAFFPIVNGECTSPDDNPQGVIALPHIGFSLSTGDRYAATFHELEDIAIYKREPGQGLFSPVNPADYNVTVESQTFIEYPTLGAVNVTYVDFLAELPEGTEVRADIWGINFRGAWNGIPTAATFEENRNPINFFINMIFLIMLKAGQSDSIWEVSTIEAVLNKFETILPSASGGSRFLCDGAITKAQTVREWLGNFLVNFEIDFFQQKNGKIAIAYVEDTNPYRHVFTAGRDVEMQSFFEDIAKPTVNQCRFHFQLNYAEDQYASNEIFDNAADQYALGDGVFDLTTGSPVVDASGIPIRNTKLEVDDFYMDFVRDVVTATYVTTRRMSFLALGSFRQMWTMDLPETIGYLELSGLAGLTHYDGLQVGGYVNKEVKILGIVIDLDKLKVTVTSILRVPQTISAAYTLNVTGESEFLMSFTEEIEGEAQ